MTPPTVTAADRRLAKTWLLEHRARTPIGEPAFSRTKIAQLAAELVAVGRERSETDAAKKRRA